MLAVLTRERPTSTFTIRTRPHKPFTINEPAFAQWITDAGDDFRLPRESDEHPGLSFAMFLEYAMCNNVIEADEGVRLAVNGDDYEDSPGYYVLVRNRHGDHQNIEITGGWQPLTFVDADSEESVAYWYLAQICQEANALFPQSKTWIQRLTARWRP